MNVFKSLNCSLCKSSFAPIANQPKSPRHLNCGKQICHKCFEEEKQLKKEERKHQCDNKDCFSNPNFAYSLIDILLSNSLVHVPIRGGYMLAENFVSPECPVCHEEFTVDGEKQPYFLNCLHDLCKECFEKCRKPNEGEKKDEMRYTVTCPKCKAITRTNYPYSGEAVFLKRFVDLPESIHKPGKSKKSYYHFCDDCICQIYEGYMLCCLNCQGKVCNTCALKMPHYPAGISCTWCDSLSTDGDVCLDKQLSEFLKELPEMTRQLEGMKNSQFRFCDPCKSLDSIERMFNCSQCQQNICGTCAFQNHQSSNGHDTVGLLEKEAIQLSDSLRQASITEVEAYQNLFPTLHQNIDDKIKDFLKKLTSKEEMLRKKPTFESLQMSYDSCKRLKSDFESTAEEYLPNLRKCDARLEDLIKALEKETN